MPEPEPPLKIMPSVRHQSRIDSMSSSTERMKHAEHCGFSLVPTLNQTGLLKHASWLIRMWRSSFSNVSASSSEAKYGTPERSPVDRSMSAGSRPHCVIAFDDAVDHLARAGLALSVSMRPRKYFDATTCVAVCDQNDGISMSVCSKNVFPVSSEMEAVRFIPVDDLVGAHAGRREEPLQPKPWALLTARLQSGVNSSGHRGVSWSLFRLTTRQLVSSACLRYP